MTFLRPVIKRQVNHIEALLRSWTVTLVSHVITAAFHQQITQMHFAVQQSQGEAVSCSCEYKHGSVQCQSVV